MDQVFVKDQIAIKVEHSLCTHSTIFVLLEIAAIAEQMRDQIEAFKPYVGLMQSLRRPGMKPRHFDQLSELTGIQMSLTSALTMKGLLVLGISDFEETVKTVSDNAAKEHAVEESLDKMINEWKTITMEVNPYKNTGEAITRLGILKFLKNLFEPIYYIIKFTK